MGVVVQKLMGHQVEVVGTLGEAVVLINTKPEAEEARIVEGEDCSGLTGGNSNDDGAVKIDEWLRGVSNDNCLYYLVFFDAFSVKQQTVVIIVIGIADLPSRIVPVFALFQTSNLITSNPVIQKKELFD